MHVQGQKVFVSSYEIAAFKRTWPCSGLSDCAYWFEFAANGDLVDTDVAPHDSGAAAAAVADECRKYLMEGVAPDWAACTTENRENLS